MTRNKSIISILLFSLVLIIAGCTKDNKGAYYPTPTDFKVEPVTPLTVSVKNGSIDFNVEGGNLGWWIETDQDWITPNVKYGSGNAKATLNYTQNNSGVERKAIVTFNPTRGLEPVTFTVEQQGK